VKRYFGLLVVLAALGALVLSQAAGAATAAWPAAAVVHPTLRDDEAGAEEEFEAEEGEFEVEECESGDATLEFEEGEEEFDEGEFEAECDEGPDALEAAAKGAPAVSAPAACKVREAESTITVLPGPDEVRLKVRYSAWSPTQVTVGVKLKDHKGGVAIAHATKHLGARGVLHVDTKLGAGLMERALKAGEFDVSLRAPETPDSCAGALEAHLHTVKHTSARAPRVYAG
jgi:hypothetical protein